MKWQVLRHHLQQAVRGEEDQGGEEDEERLAATRMQSGRARKYQVMAREPGRLTTRVRVHPHDPVSGARTDLERETGSGHPEDSKGGT